MLLLALIFSAGVALTQTKPEKTLDIYVVDVEGGTSMLFVTPSGESGLIDTGNVAGAGRDADRITAAARDAGLKQIDHMIITHYHNDHVGGIAELASRFPIKEYIDHGSNVQPNPNMDAILQRYAELYAKAKRTIVKPGDKIPVAGVGWHIVTSAGEVLKTPLPGTLSKPNSNCTGYRPRMSQGTRMTCQWGASSRLENFAPFSWAI